MADKIQLRRDTATNWTSANPVLAQGELAYELDTGRYKTGDGTTDWNSLPYIFENDTDDQTAVEVPVTPSGNLTSTDVQAALEELQADIDNAASEILTYELYETGTTTLGASYLIVPMNTEESTQPDFSQQSAGAQVALAGRYKISYSVSSDSTDGDRATTQCALFINGTELVRSRSYAYHRNTASGEGTATKSIIISLAANDIVNVRALIYGDNVTTIDRASNLILEKIA